VAVTSLQQPLLRQSIFAVNFTKRTLLAGSRQQRMIRWARGFLLLVGVVALTYVGFTLLEAKLFQSSANDALLAQSETAANTNVLKSTIRGGDVLGRIDVPRLGLSVAILQGTSLRTLRLGAGHIEGTPLPGEPGNSGIAGHRDTFFRSLKDIRKDDEIQFQTATGLLRYEVDWTKIVGPDDMSVLRSSGDDSTLTLVTCYPFYLVGPAPKRFVVHARKN
jgi:sortase A